MTSHRRGALAAPSLAALVALALLGPATVAPAAPSKSTARVYVSLPRQGQGAPSAALIAKGLRAALNERDGVAGGRRIRFVWLDDAKGARWNRARVVANARRAAADPAAVAYVGEGNSEATAVSMPIVNRAGLVHLSPVSTASALTDATTAGRYQPSGAQTFFRPVPGDARQSAALLSAVRRAGVRTRVVVVDDGTLYGRGLTQGFGAGAVAARVGVVARYVADRDGSGLSRLARRVAAQRPTAIVYGGSPSSNAAKALRALHRAAPEAVLFGGDALAHDDFVARLGTAQTRIRITTPAAHVDPRRKAGRALGTRPDPFSVFAYNGMEALLAAVDRAGRRGPVTRAAVREAVFDGSIQRGLSGQWRITDRGDSVYGIYDIVRAARGRTVTPVDRLADELVRKARTKAGGRPVESPGGRGTTRSSGTLLDTSSASALTLDSMDLETALLVVQTERTRLLDDQLATQLGAIRQRNQHLTDLNAVLTALQALLGRFPATAEAGSRLAGTGAATSYAGLADGLRGAAATAGTDLGLDADAAGWTREQLDALVTTIKGRIDGLANSQQMDMLRLQALTNKRNEAFAVMTAFVQRMQDSRASIIGPLR